MQPNVEYYQGREQSYIKHLFLQKYLESAAYKLFQGRSPVFNFVDAFAGPWRNTDTAKQSDTSFALALATLENVRSILEGIGLRGLKVRFRFCERDPDSFARLQAFASENSQFDIRVFPGAFEDTGDAIHAQAETAQLVLDRSGDDLCALKANRPAMLEAVAAFFADPPAPLEAFQTTDADHGRIETRRHRVTHSVDWLFGDRAEPGAPAMPGLAALACVEATRDDGPLLPVFRAPGRVAAVVEIGGRRNLRVT